MSPRLFAITLILLLVLGEVGLGVWRNSGNDPSTSAVFSFPVAQFGNSENVASAMELYMADRGAECSIVAADGTRMTVFYFEWDRVEAGPVMAVGGHAPDGCNLALGHKLVEGSRERVFEVAGQPPLRFDCTRFADSSGVSIDMFKLAWIQGIGSWGLREGENRMERMQNSFVRGVGAARVLQAGVFGAHDPDHAWRIFQAEVLGKLKWKESSL